MLTAGSFKGDTQELENRVADLQEEVKHSTYPFTLRRGCPGQGFKRKRRLAAKTRGSVHKMTHQTLIISCHFKFLTKLFTESRNRNFLPRVGTAFQSMI